MSVRRIVKPVSCAINGYALGAGLEMALSCDIASPAKPRAGRPRSMGWIGRRGNGGHAVEKCGMSNAALMLMSGDPVDAAPHAMALISEVVAPEALLSRAEDLPTP